MGVYEWVLLGVTFAVTLAAFFIVLALELRKHKTLCAQIPQVILRTRIKLIFRIVLMITSVLLLIAAPVVVICGSLLIEPIPHGPYAAIMALIAFGGLMSLCGIFASFYNEVYATEEGVWVRRIFLKTKFYRYEEIRSVFDGTYFWMGAFIIYKEGRKKIFSIAPVKDINANELIALLTERAPYLKRWN